MAFNEVRRIKNLIM